MYERGKFHWNVNDIGNKDTEILYSEKSLLLSVKIWKMKMIARHAAEQKRGSPVQTLYYCL